MHRSCTNHSHYKQTIKQIIKSFSRTLAPAGCRLCRSMSRERNLQTVSVLIGKTKLICGRCVCCPGVRPSVLIYVCTCCRGHTTLDVWRIAQRSHASFPCWLQRRRHHTRLCLGVARGLLLQQAESRPGCSTKGLITLNLFSKGICLG